MVHSPTSKRTGLEKILIATTVLATLTAIGLLVGLIVVALSGDDHDHNVCTSEACVETAHMLMKNMKTDVDPCDNFWEYACGRFVEEKVIPDDKTQITAFNQIDDQMKIDLRIIVNEAINASEIKPFQDLKKLNRACLDLNTIENLGVRPLTDLLLNMGGMPILGQTISPTWSWTEATKKMREQGFPVNSIFTFGVSIDQQNSTQRIGRIDQTSLGLSYEYIIKREEDEFYKAYRDYQVDIVKLLADGLNYNINQDELVRQMGRALELEFRLANISLTREERRDATKLYNPMPISELETRYPYISWLDYFNSLMPAETQFTSSDIIINAVPSFFEKLNGVLNDFSNVEKANYLMWRATSGGVAALGKAFRDRQLEFSKITTGREVADPRGLQCTEITLNYFGHALGALYVRKHFNENAKAKMDEMVVNLKKAFKEILDEIDWMDDKTKQAAHEKADAMKSQMAYSIQLLNDSALVAYYDQFNFNIDEGQYFQSILNIGISSTTYSLNKLREPVDKDEWSLHVLPAIVNAFYSSLENTIKFPAGILQGAFFNVDRPEYMNYGAIGFVIGHEITHGFDDQGSRYDPIGNLNNWWDNTTRKNFEDRAKCLIDQYGAFVEPQTGLNLNGVNTQGENIADNGGIKESYRAYVKYVESKGEEKLLPGISLNQRQLFWVSAGQVWCSVLRDATMRNRILTGVHSPNQFRVNGPMRNAEDFSKDFKCDAGKPMNPTQKCSVW